MPRHPRHIIVTDRRWPERYFTGLTLAQKKMREKELLRRRSRLGPSNALVQTKKSKWTLQFHKVYPTLKFNKTAIAARTGIPRQALNTVYDRGLKAWRTGGSRPGATAQQWAVARTYKYILLTKRKAPLSWYKGKYDPDANLRLKKSRQ